MCILRWEYSHNVETRKYTLDLLVFCKKIEPYVAYYKKQMKSYNYTAHNILSNEIDLILLQLPTKQKCGIIITLVSSFIGLAYEGISSFLHNKRHKASNKTVKTLDSKTTIQHNSLKANFWPKLLSTKPNICAQLWGRTPALVRNLVPDPALQKTTNMKKLERGLDRRAQKNNARHFRRRKWFRLLLWLWFRFRLQSSNLCISKGDMLHKLLFDTSMNIFVFVKGVKFLYNLI